MDMMVATTEASVADIVDESSLAVGGLCGIPETLIRALHAQGAGAPDVVSSNCGVDDRGILLTAGRIARVTGSYVEENQEFARQYLSGELEVELTPQGSARGRRRNPRLLYPAVQRLTWRWTIFLDVQCKRDL